MNPPPERRRDRARSPHRRYLDLAADLAAGAAHNVAIVPTVVGQVTLAEVAGALAVSRTSLYRAWPTQEDFWVDLTWYLVRPHDHVRRSDEATASLATPDGDAAAGLEAVRLAGNRLHEGVLDDVSLLVRAALLGQPDIPGIADLRRGEDESRLRLLTGRVDAILAGLRRTPVPGVTTADLAAVMWCIGDGLSTTNRYEPAVGETTVELDDGDGARPWTLYALALRGVLLGLTRPIGEAMTAPPRPAAAGATLDRSSMWTPAQLEALDAATAIFVRRLTEPHDGPVAVPNQVTVARVARLVGVSRQRVHELWPTNSALRHAVLTLVLERDRRDFLARFDRGLTRASNQRQEVVAHVVESVVPLEDDRPPRLDVRLAYLAQVSHAEIGNTFRSAYGRLAFETASRIQQVWDASGARFRDGVEPRHLAMLLTTGAFGAYRLRRANPGALRLVRPPTGRRVSSLALAARAIAEASLAPGSTLSPP